MTSPRGGSLIASNRAPPLLVLASESPRRLALLSQIGIVPYAVMPANVDETIRRGEQPRLHALRLALDKARVAGAKWDGAPALILGADTVVSCGRRILPKAETEEDVGRCIALLSGRSHQVFTAVALVGPDRRVIHRVTMTRVTFDRLSTVCISAYAASGEGLLKAGGYAIQGSAERFVRRISGSYSNVVGLPLRETATLLSRGGLPISCSFPAAVIAQSIDG